MNPVINKGITHRMPFRITETILLSCLEIFCAKEGLNKPQRIPKRRAASIACPLLTIVGSVKFQRGVKEDPSRGIVIVKSKW